MEVITRLNIVRGDDWKVRLQFKQNGTPINITTWTMAAQLRLEPDADTKTTLAITTVDASIGVVDVSLTKAQTAVLKGIYVWDLERTVSGQKLTVAAGELNVQPDVTREV